MQSAQCNIWSTCSRIMSHDDDDDDDAVVIAVSLCLQKTKTILAPYLTVLASVTTPTLSSSSRLPLGQFQPAGKAGTHSAAPQLRPRPPMPRARPCRLLLSSLGKRLHCRAAVPESHSWCLLTPPQAPQSSLWRALRNNSPSR